MTVLEKRLSKERLLMTLNKEDVRNLSVQVPAGMVPVDRKERIRYRDAWCELLVRLGFEADLKHAYGRFDGMVEKDEKFFLDHLYLLRESDGRLASACGLWYGNDFREDRLRLHYVLTSPQSQKKGAAHYVVSQAVLAYFHMYDAPLYLSTQAQSWPAIRLYFMEAQRVSSSASSSWSSSMSFFSTRSSRLFQSSFNIRHSPSIFSSASCTVPFSSFTRRSMVFSAIASALMHFLESSTPSE